MHRAFLIALFGMATLSDGGHSGVLAAPVEAPPRSPAASCVHVALDPRPEHAMDAAWRPDGRELVVPDPPGGSLWRYDLTGKLLGRETRPSRSGLGWTNPVAISTLPSGFLLMDVHRPVWLDAGLQPLRTIDPHALRMTPAGRLDTFWSWSVAGDMLYAISDIRLADDKWQFAFVAASLRDLTRFRVLREIPLSDRQEIDFYPWRHRQVAVVDGAAFFLAMTAPPRILVDGDPRRWLRAVSADMTRPALPLSQGLRNLATKFALYEKSAGPVGIYGFDHRLYLLTRHPAATAGTVWTLQQIDPRTDRLERIFTLPTTANHLVLAPGPLAWAVIEEGPVGEGAEQDVHHLLLIPTSQLTSARGSAATPLDLCS